MCGEDRGGEGEGRGGEEKIAVETGEGEDRVCGEEDQKMRPFGIFYYIMSKRFFNLLILENGFLCIA